MSMISSASSNDIKAPVSKMISLKRNVFWVLAGNIIGSACTYLMLVVLAKLGNSETVGLFGICQAVALPISTFLTLRLRTVQVTDVTDEFQFSDYYFLALLTACVAVLAITVAAFLKENSLDSVLSIIVLGCVYATVNLRQVFFAVMQKSERMYLITIGHSLSGVMSLILFTLLYFSTSKLYFALAGYFIAQAMMMSFYDFPVTRKLMDDPNSLVSGVIHVFPKSSITKIWKLFKTCIPLAFVALLGTLLTSIPRLIMDEYMTRKQVGYYVAVSSFLVLGNLLTVAIGQAVSPRLARYFREAIHHYKTLLLKFVLMSFLIGAVGVAVSLLLGKFLLSLLFTPEYAQYADLLAWIMSAGLFLFLFSSMNTALNAARWFKVQVPIYVFVALVCFISSFYFIPRYGIYGAAYAVAFSYFSGFILNFAMVIYAIKSRSNSKLIFKEDD